jgi:hypothetical protein
VAARTFARRPTGRHRSRVSLRRAVTPSLYGLSVPTLVAASIALIGVVGASAATLGGLKTSDLGATDASVAIHTSGINATWSAVASGTSWVVNGITLTTNAGDTFAANEKLGVALVNSSGAKICDVNVTNATSTTSISIARAAINTACGATGIDFSTIDRLAVTAARS